MKNPNNEARTSWESMNSVLPLSKTDIFAFMSKEQGLSEASLIMQMMGFTGLQELLF